MKLLNFPNFKKKDSVTRPIVTSDRRLREPPVTTGTLVRVVVRVDCKVTSRQEYVHSVSRLVPALRPPSGDLSGCPQQTTNLNCETTPALGVRNQELGFEHLAVWHKSQLRTRNEG